MMIETALKEDIRETVFIADYSKHQAKERTPQKVPVFPVQSRWHEIFESHGDRVAIVTTPPPELRETILNGQHKNVRTRNLRADDALWAIREIREYEDCAKKLEEISRGKRLQSRFFEAV